MLVRVGYLNLEQLTPCADLRSISGVRVPESVTANYRLLDPGRMRGDTRFGPISEVFSVLTFPGIKPKSPSAASDKRLRIVTLMA